MKRMPSLPSQLLHTLLASAMKTLMCTRQSSTLYMIESVLKLGLAHQLLSARVGVVHVARKNMASASSNKKYGCQ